MSRTRILGISAYYHDAAAALIVDGEIVAAAQEERFTRKKGDADFPHRAISYCLGAGGIDAEDLDAVVFYESPLAKFERLLVSHAVTAPDSLRSFLTAMPPWLTSKLWQETEIGRQLGLKKRVRLCDHHLSHAASAFYPSPFARAAVLTVDGVGEWTTASYGVCSGNQIELRQEMPYPNSVGLLYSAFTYYTGFKINSGEYKLMGLAPYGRPIFADRIREKVARFHPDGSITLNQDYFNYAGGLTMTNARFHALFGGPPRAPESDITQRDMDLAASIQSVLNDVMMRMAVHVHRETGEENLVMAGGVALNVVANGLLLSGSPFKRIWIQPAAGDAGGAVGAALWWWYQSLDNERTPQSDDSMRGAFLGTDIGPASLADDEILESMGGRWTVLRDDDLVRRIAREVASGRVVGVARGRMEFGPRALGARSILGDARSPRMQRHMNLKIKFRESFRPFAAMVLEEDAAQYFEGAQPSPYMLLVFPVQENRRRKMGRPDAFGLDLINEVRSDIPAVTHVDYSSRVQTVDANRNPFMYEVLGEYKRQTGASIIVNTSFNVRGEPIVNSVEDAYRCFMATDIDALVVGNRFFERERQINRPMNDQQREEWLRRFDLD